MSFPIIIVLSIIYIVFDLTCSSMVLVVGYDCRKKTAAFWANFCFRLALVVLSYILDSKLYYTITIVLGFPLTFLIVYLFIDKNICRCMTKFCIYEFIHSGISIITSFIFTHVFKTGITELTLFNDSMEISTYAIGFLFTAVNWLPSLYCYYRLKLFFRKKEIPQKICGWLTVMLVIFIIIEIYTNVYAFFSYENIYTGPDFYFKISLVILAGVLIKLAYDNYIKHKMRTENTYLEQLNEMQFKHYHDLDSYYNEIREMRHDIVNHLHTMQILLEKGEHDECERYTHSLISQFGKRNINFCENKTIDAVLHDKAKEAEKRGIEFSASVNVGNDIGIRPIDIVCILANLLDNAIESADKCENKFIHIRAGEANERLVIKCENSCNGIIKINSDSTIKTSKKEPLHHGFGTKIIKRTAESYGGCIFCEAAEDTFNYTVMIPLSGSVSES